MSSRIVSVPSRGFNSHYSITAEDTTGILCFRPLSGIQFSLLPSGVTFSELAEFPSPLGDSILITIFSPLHTRECIVVSVPSRGFNSHYSVAARPHKHWPEKPVCGAKPISVTSIDYYRSLCPKNPINTACGSKQTVLFV